MPRFAGLLAMFLWFVASPAHATLYRLPLSSDTAVHYYFDQNPGGGVLDWNCGPYSYNGHRGTDFSGGPAGRAIFAGADGVIAYKIDGYGDGYSGSTDGGGFGNHVRLTHGNGAATIYGHLLINTVTTKAVGAAVACGEQIGGVGTSGNSTGLHLHFEVRPGGLNSPAVDPYAGPCSTPVSLWVNQGAGSPTNLCENGVTGPPTAPNLLTASAVSASQINVNWTDNAVNETGYEIERALLPGGPWAQIATAGFNTTAFASAGLAASSTYFYRVRATNEGGVSAWSNVGTATTSNALPVVTAIPNQFVAGGSVLTFAVTATDEGLGITTVITDFESYVPGTAAVMFRLPNYSGTTSAYLTSPNVSEVAAAFPGGHPGTRVLNVNWGFTTSASAWLRLTTASAPYLPNPTVSFAQILRFDIHTDKSLKLGLGLRETSTTADIGANGGGSGSIEWVGATNASGGTPRPVRVLPAGVWTNLSFNVPFEPVTAFTGNGVLTSSTGKGALEELAFVPNAGAGAYNVYLDNFTSTHTNRLIYSLDAGAPAGATINSNSGVFNWTTPVVAVNTTNTITVRVTDNGSSPLNAARTFQVIVTPQPATPPAPVAGAATSVTSAGFTANWSSAAGATGYRLDVSAHSAFTNYVADYQNRDAGNALSLAVTGLTANATYYYRVRATNAAGTSSNSASITVLTAPPAPNVLGATGVTADAFTAHWSVATGATGYRLDVATDSGFNSFVAGYQDRDVGNALLQDVSGLNGDTTYHYRVRAYNSGGISGNSGTISVTTAPGAPPAPTVEDATDATTNAFTAHWSAVSGAAGYRLDVSPNSGFNTYLAGHQNLDVGNVLSRVVTNLAAGSAYYYRVRAYSAGSTSGDSATMTALTVPAAPIAGAATSVGGTGFTANWSAATGAAGYRLDVSTNAGFGVFVNGYEDLDAGGDLSHSVVGLSSSTTHYYRVRAYNFGGVSANSAIITVVTAGPGCTVNELTNSSFEEGSVNGVAVGWIGYQRAPNPATGWSLQTASPPPGGGLKYQQIANTSSTGGGGVRQNIAGCTVGATYTISGWMRGNSVSYATCTVKVSPSASTNWATAIHLDPPQTVTGDSWVGFSGTVVATGTNMTLWLDGQTTGTGQNKAQCFDAVAVTCAAMPPRFQSVSWLSPGQARVVLTGEPGAGVTILRSSNLVQWLPLTNLTIIGGAVEFIDGSLSNAPQRFYRALNP